MAHRKQRGERDFVTRDSDVGSRVTHSERAERSQICTAASHLDRNAHSESNRRDDGVCLVGPSEGKCGQSKGPLMNAGFNYSLFWDGVGVSKRPRAIIVGAHLRLPCLGAQA